MRRVVAVLCVGLLAMPALVLGNWRDHGPTQLCFRMEPFIDEVQVAAEFDRPDAPGAGDIKLYRYTGVWDAIWNGQVLYGMAGQGSWRYDPFGTGQQQVSMYFGNFGDAFGNNSEVHLTGIVGGPWKLIASDGINAPYTTGSAAFPNDPPFQMRPISCATSQPLALSQQQVQGVAPQSELGRVDAMQQMSAQGSIAAGYAK